MKLDMPRLCMLRVRWRANLPENGADNRARWLQVGVSGVSGSGEWEWEWECVDVCRHRLVVLGQPMDAPTRAGLNREPGKERGVHGEE